MNKISSVLAIMLAVVMLSSCNNCNNNEQTLEEKAQEDMVSLFKQISRVPSSVKVSNIVPYISCDSIYCCTCHVQSDNTDGVTLNTIFDYTLVKYKDEDGKITFYNYINDLSKPNQKRQDKWYRDYFFEEHIGEKTKEFHTPEEFMMNMIYTSADIENRSMKLDYSLN